VIGLYCGRSLVCFGAYLEVNEMRSSPERANFGRQDRRLPYSLLSSFAESSSLIRFCLGHHLQFPVFSLSSSMTNHMGYREPVDQTRVFARSSAFLTIFVLSCALVLITAPGVFATTWSPEMLVNIPDGYDDWAPDIAIDTTGRAWVVWMGVDPVEGDEEIYYRCCENGGWGPQGLVNPADTRGDRFPELCTGLRDGVPWCIWARWNSVVGAYDFVVSHWVGDGWSLPETVFVGGSRYDGYEIVARDTSLVWALWSTRTTVPPTHKDIFARGRVNGVWGPVEQIELPQGHEGEVRAALDSKDRLWAVWQSDSVDKIVIQSCVRDESGWGEVIHVAAEPGGSFCPAVAIDDNDVAWIVWYSGDLLGGSDVWSARWACTGWEHLGKVSESGGTGNVSFNHPVICNVPASGPLVVWWGGPQTLETKDIYESKWTVHGWRPPGHVSVPDSVFLARDQYPSLAVDKDRTAWVCWMWAQTEEPYDTEIKARYSSDVTLVSGLADLRGEVRDGVVVLSWSADYPGSFVVFRRGQLAPRASSEGNVHMLLVDCGSVSDSLPQGAERLTEEPLVGSGRLEYTDYGCRPGYAYEYWIVEEVEVKCYLHGPIYAEIETLPGTQIESVYPNPLRPGGWIQWSGAEGDRLEVWDVHGGLVRVFSQEEGLLLSNSRSLVYWDGRNSGGREVASGVYLLVVASASAASGATFRKAVVLR